MCIYLLFHADLLLNEVPHHESTLQFLNLPPQPFDLSLI